MLFNIQAARRFVIECDYVAFCDDLKTRYATERAIQNIEEAAIQLEKYMQNEVGPTFSLTQVNNTIPWRKIKAMSNILRHDYDDIDNHVIWDVVQNHLPELEIAVKRLLDKA